MLHWSGNALYRQEVETEEVDDCHLKGDILGRESKFGDGDDCVFGCKRLVGLGVVCRVRDYAM
jgi:hypothetical protein